MTYTVFGVSRFDQIGLSTNRTGRRIKRAASCNHLFRLPRLGGLEGPHEHLVQPQSVRSVGVDDVVRVDNVPSRFAHLLPVRAEDHSLLLL